MSLPRSNGAEDATAGLLVTATRAADLLPEGSVTTFRRSTRVKPLGVKLVPGRFVVVPVHRSKNFSVYPTCPFWGLEYLISTITLHELFSLQFV